MYQPLQGLLLDSCGHLSSLVKQHLHKSHQLVFGSRVERAVAPVSPCVDAGTSIDALSRDVFPALDASNRERGEPIRHRMVNIHLSIRLELGLNLGLGLGLGFELGLGLGLGLRLVLVMQVTLWSASSISAALLRSKCMATSSGF